MDSRPMGAAEDFLANLGPLLDFIGPELGVHGSVIGVVQAVGGYILRYHPGILAIAVIGFAMAHVLFSRWLPSNPKVVFIFALLAGVPGFQVGAMLFSTCTVCLSHTEQCDYKLLHEALEQPSCQDVVLMDPSPRLVSHLLVIPRSVSLRGGVRHGEGEKFRRSVVRVSAGIVFTRHSSLHNLQVEGLNNTFPPLVVGAHVALHLENSHVAPADSGLLLMLREGSVLTSGTSSYSEASGTVIKRLPDQVECLDVAILDSNNQFVSSCHVEGGNDEPHLPSNDPSPPIRPHHMAIRNRLQTSSPTRYNANGALDSEPDSDPNAALNAKASAYTSSLSITEPEQPIDSLAKSAVQWRTGPLPIALLTGLVIVLLWPRMHAKAKED